jgi:thiamine kinase-like enzyme
MEPITNPQGLVIQSNFEGPQSTTVMDSDMEQWPQEAVFCHNDLTLRNLILKASEGPDGNTR